MNKKLINTLLDLGLTQHEARVYIAGLSLGPTTIAKLASSSDIKRTTVYNIVASLKQKGLMRIEMNGWKKLFVVESPETLPSMLDQKKQKLQNILPNFLSLYNLTESEAFIKYYEGIESMKTVYASLLHQLHKNDFYLAVSDTDKFQNIDRQYFDNFIEQRSKLQLSTRLLLQDSPLARERQPYAQNANEEIKVLPKHTQLSTNLVITPHKVIIHQLTTPIIVMTIENSNIIQMHKEMFEIMWNSIE